MTLFGWQRFVYQLLLKSSSQWPKTRILLLAFFLLSRLFIWVYKPTNFTEITYSYMPYAQLWASGTTPYLEQWYEYPPATIPLFYLPHVIDMSTHGTPWHVNYGQAYRGQLLIIDVLLFWMIWTALHRSKTRRPIMLIALIYYSLATAKAHHFMYDTMDLTFATAMTLTIAAPIIFSGARGFFGQWLGYGLALGLKLLNGPMGLIYAVADRKYWKKSLIMGVMAFLLTWGLPLFLYRSSLQVMLVYHQLRGLQIDSAGAIVVRVIDSFTDSERVIEVYKNYEIAGPVTDIMLRIISPLFILTLVGFILYGTWVVFRSSDKLLPYHRISLTLGYALLLMLSMKVLSMPFMLWHIPLIALYPFARVSTQLKFVLASVLIVILTLSPIPRIEFWMFDTPLMVGVARTLLFGYLFYLWWTDHRRHLRQVRSA